MCTEVIVKMFLRVHKMIINPFIDDFSHICHGEEEEAIAQFSIAKEEIRSWGFVISEEKVVKPARQNVILGYLIDTTTMTIKFDVCKLDELRFLIMEAIQPKVEARYLAKIVGKIMALGYASKVPVASFLPRSIAAIAETTEEGDWKAWRKELVVTKQIHEELVFVLNNLSSWNGQDVKKPMRIHFFTSENPIAEKPFEPFIGDASKEAAAFFSIRNPHKFAIKFFPESLAMASSSRRELASVEMLVMEHSDWFQPGSTIVYASDSTSLNRWVNVGSCKPDIARILQRIFLKCFDLGVDLRVTWVPRSHALLEEADLLSRRDTDEFTLRNRDWGYIKWQYGKTFTLDVFASQFLFRAQKYYSKFPSRGSSGTDGLYQQWSQEEAWIFPPRKLLGPCIRRIQVEADLKGALVGLDNSEGLIRSILFPNNHAPEWVWQVYKFPIKVRMGFTEELSDAMRNNFSATWHDLIVLFIDKSYSQRFLPARCFKKRGECQECGGNDFVTDMKHPY